MPQDRSINYVELPAADIPATRNFYKACFGWQFQDYGPEYCAIVGAGLDGGFFQSNQHSSSTDNGAALVVIYAEKLEAVRDTIVDHNGRIAKDIFAFPGGRRFHFLDPSGNELAVWSDKE